MRILLAAAVLLAPSAFAQLTLNPGSFLGVDTDFGTNRTLVQVDATGTITDSLALSTSAFGAAVGVAVIGGDVFVASVDGVIEQIDLNTGVATLVTTVFGVGLECLSSSNGELLVQVWNTNEVQRFSTSGTLLGSIFLPGNVAATGFDATADSLFFARWAEPIIDVFDSSGALVESITHSLNTNAVSSMAYRASTDSFFLCTGFGADQIFEVDRNGVIQQSFPSPVAWLNGVTLVGDGSLGMNYCGPAVANSTGQPGMIEGLGSLSVNDNDFSLRASQLPDGAFGFFIVSADQGFVMGPGGSDGNLCLSGSVGRFVAQIGQVSGGALEIQVDLTGLPVPPTFSVAVQSGDTWNFQCWHRDMGATATSNFTDGLSVTFQ